MKTILVVDDEKSVRDSIKMILEYERYNVLLAENSTKALSVFKEESPDVVFLDIKMPSGKDGIEVLRDLKQMNAGVPIIMISGHGTFDTAVEATKLGAFDYLAKPLDRDKLLIALRNALEQRQLTEEVRTLREKERILGASQKIKEILTLVQRVGPSDARILITGESGTGKELVAKAIHRASKRVAMPLVEVNCAAIPSELIESELFGHEKGSFTGATTQRIGKFEQADGGTIFLDEIGDMSLQAQAKVLRALEEGKIERVGGSKTLPVDVRVIAATNKNLHEEIKKGSFREDLYHRLNVIPIQIPPLRERKEDIPILVEAFIDDVCSRNGIAQKKISERAIQALTTREWSGNVRELRNIIERLVIMTNDTIIDSADAETSSFRKGSVIDDFFSSSSSFQEFKDRAETAFLSHQLKLHGWNVSKTAEALGMERSHLYTKIKKYNLEREGKEGVEDEGEKS
ncbi:MAG: sigma-54-dependent Fis family transcriptional regulator [Ignavibacteriae bacterium]|nr:sigma-54-dependent Fis family transcriptional regulator [Ignavibacteria bacterium]MBI3363419.1 sigma-54-dependent Fis family transcriptional regulator [Ignavibacteriota bacterium]